MHAFRAHYYDVMLFIERTLVPLASRLGKYINAHAVQCQLIHHARSRDLSHAVLVAQAVPELTVKAHLVLDRAGPAVLIIPFQAKPGIDALNRFASRNFQLIDDEQAGRLFPDCDHGHIPVLAQAYDLPLYVDETIFSREEVFASSGCANTLLRMSQSSVKAALREASRGQFSENLLPAESVLCSEKEYSLDDIARKLTRLYRLPPMPETSVRIMHLTSNPDSSLEELVKLVERDPSLSAQILRYARSALFNYRGQLHCVRDAINVVLGFDRVAKLAMGISSAQAFRVPSHGALGLSNFWKHALHCAVLTEALALMAKPELELDARESYLSGLLHNFGLLLIGQLFPPEFRMMNKLRESEPERSMAEIEKQVFGMGSAQEFIALGHGSLGAILLKLWGLPESCIKVAAMHQNEYYEGEHEGQVALVRLSNYLLSLHGVGDEPASMDPEPLFEMLGIDSDKAFRLAEATIEHGQELDGLVSDLVA